MTNATRTQDEDGRRRVLWAAAAVLFLGLAYRFLFRLNGFQLDWDHSLQTLTALSLVQGGPWGYARVRPDDISITRFYFDTDWPPGFFLLYSTLLRLGFSEVRGLIVLEAINYLVVFAALIGILWAARPLFGNRVTLIAAAVWGWLGPPPGDAPYANLTSWALFLLALTVAGRAVGERGRRMPLLLSGFLLGMAVTFRYAYVACVPSVFLGLFLIERRLLTVRNTALHLFGIVSGVVPIALHYWAASRVSPFVMDKLNPAALHPEHLIRMHPFGTDALFSDSLTVLLPDSVYRWADSPAPWLFLLRSVLSLAVLSIALGQLLSFLRSGVDRDGSPNQQKARFVLIAGLAGGFFTVAMLCCLSLTNARHMPMWTFVQESRYYLPLMPFLGLLLVRSLRQRELGQRERGQRGWNVSAPVITALIILALPLRIFSDRSLPAANHRTEQLDSYFLGWGSEHLPILREIRDPSLPNVFVQVHPEKHGKPYFMALTAASAGWSGVVLSPNQPLLTSKRVQVALFSFAGERAGGSDRRVQEWCNRRGVPVQRNMVGAWWCSFVIDAPGIDTDA